MQDNFSSWYRWEARRDYPGIAYPGIYVIAISDEDLAGKAFTFNDNVVYIGMTNSVAGLRGRLAQFDSTIANKRCLHGGADRFLFKYQDYPALVQKLYVALHHIECRPAEETPASLRAMGRVANAEYECMAMCVEKLKRLPEFNRKKHSPKYSLTHGRQPS